MLAADFHPLDHAGGEARLQVTHETERIAAISLEGEFDLTNSTLVMEQAEQTLDDHDHLIIDLSHATFIDSSTIRALVQTHNAAVKRGQVVVLQLATAATVERVLQVSGIDELLPRGTTRREAIQIVEQLAGPSGAS